MRVARGLTPVYVWRPWSCLVLGRAYAAHAWAHDARARNARTDLRGRGSYGGAGARFMVGGKSPMRVPRAGFTPVAVCGRAGARRCGRARRRGRRGRARRRTRCKRRARAGRANTGTRGRGRIGSRCGVWRVRLESFRVIGSSGHRGIEASQYLKSR